MKKTCTRMLLLILVVAFFSGCFGSSVSVDVKDINTILDLFEQSILTRDADKFASLFTTFANINGESMNYNQRRFAFSRMWVNVDVKIDEYRIYERNIVVNGSTATVKGKIRETVSGYPVENPTVTGNVLMKLRKDHDAWSISSVNIVWDL